ncbi:MAG: GntR family transcriptional regulator [Chloroflexi bacterium]|nr:GntR family transcriptional regulator [Chloroflexota bacterium]
MEWKIERDLPIPIAEQITGQIVYAISFGTLQPGEALPSIRELAGILKVSPVTISKVYRELIKKSLLVSKPYIGVFVNELGVINGQNFEEITHQNLQTIFINAIRQAKLMGYSTEEIRAAFSQADLNLANADIQKTILVISNFYDATHYYALEIESILEGINLKAVPLILTDLKTRLPELLPQIKNAQFAVTVPERLQEVREILEPDYCRVLAIAFELSQTTIKQLSAITPDQKVGIVSTYPEYVNTMLNELTAYGPITHTPIVALLSQEERVKKMLLEIDVLIYASGSEIVKEWAPKGLEMFEFLHTPKPDSVNRLRPLL